MGKQDILSNLYSNLKKSPVSFRGVKELHKAAQEVDKTITLRDVSKFLQGQKSYTLHKLTRKRFLRRRILAPRPKVIISSDLADMSLLAKSNKGYRYLLVVIDVFSRYAKVSPMKRKNGSHTVEALRDIIESPEFRGVSRLNTDEGGEYYNATVKKYLSSKNITLYSVSSREIKAAIAERFIRTLKGLLYRYMTHNNTRTYINIVNDIVNNYNNTYHRSIKMTPLQLHSIKDDAKMPGIFKSIYKKPSKRRKRLSSPLAVGQAVRIADEGRNKLFRQGYTIQNTLEIFKIAAVDSSQSPTIYLLRDLEEEPIKGIFYREELIPTDIPSTFEIEIIRSKKVGNRTKHLVRWRGYPSQYNSWIDDADIAR